MVLYRYFAYFPNHEWAIACNPVFIPSPLALFIINQPFCFCANIPALFFPRFALVAPSSLPLGSVTPSRDVTPLAADSSIFFPFSHSKRKEQRNAELPVRRDDRRAAGSRVLALPPAAAGHPAARARQGETLLPFPASKTTPGSDLARLDGFVAMARVSTQVYELISSGGIDPGGLGDKTGLAPIHYAAKHNNRNALELVLSRGVSVNQADRSGNTALHHAAAGGHFELVQFLVSQGAAPAARNHAGKTPYDVSSSILVSQFLMPLQLAAEQDDGAGYVAPITPVATQGYAAGYAGPYASGYSSFAPPTQPAIEHADVPGIAVDPAPLAPPAPTHLPPSLGTVPPSTATFVPAYSAGYTPTWTGSGLATTQAPTSPSAITSPGSFPAVSVPAVVPRSSTAPAPAGGRIIRPGAL